MTTAVLPPFYFCDSVSNFGFTPLIFSWEHCTRHIVPRERHILPYCFVLHPYFLALLLGLTSCDPPCLLLTRLFRLCSGNYLVFCQPVLWMGLSAQFRNTGFMNLWISKTVIIYPREYICWLFSSGNNFLLWVFKSTHRGSVLSVIKTHLWLKTFCELHLDSVSNHDTDRRID